MCVRARVCVHERVGGWVRRNMHISEEVLQQEKAKSACCRAGRKSREWQRKRPMLEQSLRKANEAIVLEQSSISASMEQAEGDAAHAIKTREQHPHAGPIAPLPRREKQRSPILSSPVS